MGHAVALDAAQALDPMPAPGNADGADSRRPGLQDVADRVAHLPSRHLIPEAPTHGADLARLARLLLAAQDLGDATHAVLHETVARWRLARDH